MEQQHLTNHRSYIPKKHSRKMVDLSENLWLSHTHTHTHTQTNKQTNGIFKNKVDIIYKCSMHTRVIWELEN